MSVFLPAIFSSKHIGLEIVTVKLIKMCFDT